MTSPASSADGRQTICAADRGSALEASRRQSEPSMSALSAVRWVELPSSADERGVLTSIESGVDVGFEIKRVFFMHHIIADRGGHAHVDTDQVVIAVAGRLSMDVADGRATETYELSDPRRGVYTPRMIFISLHDFSPDAVCLVLASTYYDMSRSIRTWDDYVKAIRGR
jgi:dTDP-4-dehydrorhamnose 3,5-epimerase-like enzyme